MTQYFGQNDKKLVILPILHRVTVIIACNNDRYKKKYYSEGVILKMAEDESTSL